MPSSRRNNIYKTVQRIALQMMQAAQERGELKSWQRPCAECGTWNAWAWRDEHRDYSDPYAIECVCAPCNGNRGPALLMLFNVETAEWEQVSPISFTKTAHVDVRHWTLDKLLRKNVVTESHLVCTQIQL